MAAPAVTQQLPGVLRDDARRIVGEELQAQLVELIDLSLQGKQAHWNVVGRFFRPLHQQLDEIVETARAWSDRIAERMAAIGAPPNGQAGTVSGSTPLPPLPPGFLHDTEVVDAFIERLRSVALRTRERADRLGGPDPVTQNMLQELGEELEKHLWMLQVQKM